MALRIPRVHRSIVGVYRVDFRKVPSDAIFLDTLSPTAV